GLLKKDEHVKDKTPQAAPKAAGSCIKKTIRTTRTVTKNGYSSTETVVKTEFTPK
ncbi:UNVERIFIED_CONTAM: hypothetical protein HDU68_005240, partial [Siphonaria sp. JEL0065]